MFLDFSQSNQKTTPSKSSTPKQSKPSPAPIVKETPILLPIADVVETTIAESITSPEQTTKKTKKRKVAQENTEEPQEVVPVVTEVVEQAETIAEVDEKRIQVTITLPWKKTIRKVLADGSKKQSEVEQLLIDSFLPKVQDKLSKTITTKAILQLINI